MIKLTEKEEATLSYILRSWRDDITHYAESEDDITGLKTTDLEYKQINSILKKLNLFSLGRGKTK